MYIGRYTTVTHKWCPSIASVKLDEHSAAVKLQNRTAVIELHRALLRQRSSQGQHIHRLWVIY